VGVGGHVKAMTGRIMMQAPASTVGPSSSLLRLFVASLPVVDVLELGLHIRVLSKVRAVTSKNPLLLLALALQQKGQGGGGGT
jgi:hypothetical protein